MSELRADAAQRCTTSARVVLPKKKKEKKKRFLLPHNSYQHLESNFGSSAGGASIANRALNHNDGQ